MHSSQSLSPVRCRRHPLAASCPAYTVTSLTLQNAEGSIRSCASPVHGIHLEAAAANLWRSYEGLIPLARTAGIQHRGGVVLCFQPRPVLAVLRHAQPSARPARAALYKDRISAGDCSAVTVMQVPLQDLHTPLHCF